MQSRNLVITLGLALAVISLVLIAPHTKVAALSDVPSTTLTYPGVPPCNTTLQACVSAANNGDVVNVSANTYITNSLIITHAITLQGAGATSTILQALGAQRVISVGVNIAAGVMISNLRVISGSLTSGGGLGAGIFADSGTPLTLLNMDVLSNTNSTNSGGGIFAGDALTMTNVNVIGNSDPGGAGGGLRASSSVVIVGGRFERNTSLNPGGAMRVTGPLALTNVTIISNSITSSTQDGGGIRADGGLTMIGGIVQNNIAPDVGGGIYANTASLTGTQVISNAGNEGGGIYVTGALAITDTTFDQNKALNGNGGAIYSSNSSLTITLASTKNPSATVLRSNTAITNGGGVFAQGNVLLIGNVSFNSNHATNGDGGGIYANNVSDASGGFINPTIGLDANFANVNGGGIRALGNVTLSTFPALSGNHTLSATGDGGAIYADGNVTVVSGFSAFNSAHNGGMIYAGGNVLIQQHAGGASNASQDGGCVYAVGDLEVVNDEFVRCSAGRNGGAFFAGQTVTITGAYNGSVLQIPGYQQNVANNGGLVYGSKVILQSVTPFSNTARSEGGVAASTGELDISDSTFMTNTARSEGGVAIGLGTGFISNSIFTSNKVTETNAVGGAIWVAGTLNITNSTFLTNTASGGFIASGGAVGATGRINLSGGLIQGNQATTGGGVRGLADVIVTGTTFLANGGSSFASGGGIVAITTTLTSVTMTQNSVCCSGSIGGAVSTTLAYITGSMFIQNSAFISGGAVIANQVFITNSQFVSNTGPSEGAGVWTNNGGTINNSIFTGNSTGCCPSRKGGAVFSRGQILIFNSQFNNNQSDTGGAIYIQSNSSEIHDSQFTGNFVHCCGGGGAIFSLGLSPYIYNSDFTGNHTDCCDDGGAISAGSYLDVERSTFQNNFVGSGSGGAIFIPIGFISAASDITASTFISNSAALYGGAIDAQNANINGSTFISNAVGSSFGGGAVNIHAFGGLDGDVFQSNRVSFTPASCMNGNGGALASDAASSLSIQRSTFAQNSAYNGGAVFAGGTATIDTSLFSDNSVSCLASPLFSNIGYGGAIVGQQGLTIRQSSFVHNSAGSIGGGAIFYQPSTASTLRVENSLFARNVATNTVFGAAGAAIGVTSTNTTQLFYNTFANGPTKNTVSAIMVYSGAVSIIDNIIANHALGIQKSPNGTASENFNLFFNNTANTGGGVVSGGNSLNSNPLFIAVGTDNYHLAPNSPAIDTATDLGITVDYDGETRPNGSGFDIGFDEWHEPKYKVYLPLVLRNS